MSWIDNLPVDVHSRLCACRNTREDLPILVNAKWTFMKKKGKDKEGFTKEDALVAVLDHLDSNGQGFIYDLTHDEWIDLCHE